MASRNRAYCQKRRWLTFGDQNTRADLTQLMTAQLRSLAGRCSDTLLWGKSPTWLTGGLGPLSWVGQRLLAYVLSPALSLIVLYVMGIGLCYVLAPLQTFYLLHSTGSCSKVSSDCCARFVAALSAFCRIDPVPLSFQPAAELT